MPTGAKRDSVVPSHPKPKEKEEERKRSADSWDLLLVAGTGCDGGGRSGKDSLECEATTEAEGASGPERGSKA